ncbi:MAG: DUF4124 domain-containing protein [Stenotrophomonas sp.]
MRVLPRSACLLLLFISAAASAGNVYKWKDANGVTQYSEKPPTGQKFEARRITSQGSAVTEAAEAATESPQCLNARKNLELLAGSGPVMRDTDGDGKPDKALDDNERTAQKNLAQAAAAAYCTPAAQG